MSIKFFIFIHNKPLHSYAPQEAFCSMFCGQAKKAKKKGKEGQKDILSFEGEIM
jgi:hypothetical protein